MVGAIKGGDGCPSGTSDTGKVDKKKIVCDTSDIMIPVVTMGVTVEFFMIFLILEMTYLFFFL